ncbi:phage virion morphogenesis protein [Limnoglobus roseus]|uniref:hypothetical protein n=1 Tax=Limnoglobus roseus TaxID=2598579 RepID=UPI0036F33723
MLVNNAVETEQMMELLELAAKLGEIELRQHEMEKHALEKAAVVVENRAKEKIGEYQNEAGPFIAWPELADYTKEDRLRKGFTENDPGLRTGEMRDSIEHIVMDGEAHVGSDDDHLVYFELGTVKQPPRSVLGGAVVEEIDKIIEIVGESAVASLVGEGVFNRKMRIEND